MSKQVAVTVNITAHKEGFFLYRSVRSALACCEYANANNIETKININLDNADSLTTRIALDFKKEGHINVYENHFGDLAASRNFLIDKTTTPYTLFFDGDDLFSDDFIVKSVNTAEDFGKICVVSAEKIFKFSNSLDPIAHITESTVDKPAIKSALFETNLYISQNLVSTEIFKKCKYEPNKGNYGFEDWHWNTKVINEGIEFLVAPGTAFFYRQKADDKSLLKASTNANTVVRQTPLFDPLSYRKLPFKRYYPQRHDSDGTRPLSTGLQVKYNYRKSLIYRAARKAYRTIPILQRLKLNTGTSPSNRDSLGKGITPLEAKSDEIAVWNRLNSIEPIIRFDSSNINSLQAYRYTFEHSLATTYYDFSERFGDEKFSDIIFVPWINKGGADLAMIDLATTLSEGGRKVLMVTTSGVDSEWAEKARKIKGVTFIQSHDDVFQYLDHLNMKTFFLRLVQNWPIETMTVMNSAIGFELIERFGPAIRDTGCKIIVHNFAFPTQDNLMIDAFPSFTNSLDRVDAIVVDSQIHQKEFYEIYDYPKSQITEVPLVVDSRIAKKTDGVKRRMLFANRIAREKRPDIAIMVAQALQEDGIELDIYGTVDASYADSVDFYNQVEKCRNVNFKGTFESSLKLDFSEYDICFMPSLYEGTPRIVLESAYAGLYVVCTDVGGMPEVVESHYSGEVLPVDATVDMFVQAIRNYYATADLHNINKRHMANKITLKKHQRDFYYENIVKIYQLNKKRQSNAKI